MMLGVDDSLSLNASKSKLPFSKIMNFKLWKQIRRVSVEKANRQKMPKFRMMNIFISVFLIKNLKDLSFFFFFLVLL